MRIVMIAALVAVLTGCGAQEFSSMDALALCDNAIKSTSINPRAVEIPHRPGVESDGTYSFAWDRGGNGILMPNQFGAQIEFDALCKVDGKNERVVYLEIGGRALSPK